MEVEPTNEEKPSDGEWPLERAEVGIYLLNGCFYEYFGIMSELELIGKS